MQPVALPTRLGGLGIADPSKQAAPQHTACRNITAPLVELIIDQPDVYTPETNAAQTRAKNRTRYFHQQQQTRAAAELKAELPSRLKAKLPSHLQKTCHQKIKLVIHSGTWLRPAQGCLQRRSDAATTSTYSLCVWQQV